MQFQQVYMISENIMRTSLKDFFWPIAQRRFGRQKLIDLNKREGWLCRFLEKGLVLEAKILISKNDYADWPNPHRTQNTNTLSSELSFHDSIEFKLSAPALKVKHPAEIAEDIRKKIYISERFGEQADLIWAAQYFEPGSDRSSMYYILGFDRKIQSSDNLIIEQIKAELSLLNDVVLLY